MVLARDALGLGRGSSDATPVRILVVLRLHIVASRADAHVGLRHGDVFLQDAVRLLAPAVRLGDPHRACKVL